MHPDQQFASYYLLDGIANGFRVGFSHVNHSCTPTNHNHPSANEHPIVISEGLSDDIQRGHLAGPFNPADYPYVHISSLGAVPKKHSDKWCLDFSHPAGSSVNDGISKSLCSLTYMKVQDAVRQILKLARVAFSLKYLPSVMCPHDRHLLGMVWNQLLYIDTVLPFGLWSAPKIFNTIAAALQWIVIQRGMSYLTAAATETECLSNLTLLIDTCRILDLALSLPKREGPSTCLVFLGIQLDTVQLELPYLPISWYDHNSKVVH